MMNGVKNYFFLFALVLLMSTLACWQTSTPEPAYIPDTRIRPDLVFTPDALPDAKVDFPYTVEIQISQNETPPGDFYLSEGVLPEGLVLEFIKDEDIARISGTLKEPGTYKFKIGVWCYSTNVVGQTGEKEYTLVVK